MLSWIVVTSSPPGFRVPHQNKHFEHSESASRIEERQGLVHSSQETFQYNLQKNISEVAKIVKVEWKTKDFEATMIKRSEKEILLMKPFIFI